GYGQESDRRRCQEAGFDHSLLKPCDPAELQRVLADYQASRRVIRVEPEPAGTVVTGGGQGGEGKRPAGAPPPGGRPGGAALDLTEDGVETLYEQPLKEEAG